jgi:hypothetical protein
MNDAWFPPPSCLPIGFNSQCAINAEHPDAWPAGFQRRGADDWVADGRPIAHIQLWGGYNTIGYDSGRRVLGFQVRFYEAPISVWCPDGSHESDTAIGAVVYEGYASSFVEAEVPGGRIGDFAYCITLPTSFANTAGKVYWLSVQADYDWVFVTSDYTKWYWRVYDDGVPDSPYCEVSWYCDFGPDISSWDAISHAIPEAACWNGYDAAFNLYSSTPPPSPEGACCFSDGSCAIRTSSGCSSGGGVYQGDGTSCTPSPCPPSLGACCFADGSCLGRDWAQCTAESGTYQGDDTSCIPNPCPEPTGACCFADGTCLVRTSAQCATEGGTYQGNGTSCTPNPCPQPTGACCFADGSCLVRTTTQCATESGTYQGNHTNCTPNPCPQPTGACCFADGSCLARTSTQCAAESGTYQGNDTTCAPNPCPQPTGACCFADGTCLVRALAQCATLGGS